MMKKNLVTAALLIGFIGTSATVHAQAALVALLFGDKVASEKFNISMEVGVNFTHFSNANNIKAYRGDLNFGIAANYMLSEYWFISPTAYFISRRTIKLSNMTPFTGDQTLNGLYANSDAVLTADYIDVPVMVYREFGKRKFRLGVGPQISFLKNATIVYNGQQGDLEVNYNSYIKDIDYGFLASFGYSLGEARKGKGIFLQLRYYQGFSDVTQSINGENRSSYVAFHASLPFVTDAIADGNLRKAKESKGKKKK